MAVASQDRFEDGIVSDRSHRVGRTFKPAAERAASRSRPFPVERDVLSRIERVVELEAMRVDRENRRLAPGHELRSGAGLTARRVDELRILPRRAGRAADGLGPALSLA